VTAAGAASAPPAAPPAERIPIGIALMLVTVFTFGVMDLAVKAVVSDLPVMQVVWARYAFHLLFMLPLLARFGTARLVRTARPGLQVVRALLLLATTAIFFLAIRYIPVASANAVGFVGPLIVTALSALILKEKVGPRRWAAVLIGFCAVMVAIRPGFGMVHWAMALPLVTATCFAFFQIVTRILSRTEDAIATMAWTGAVAAVLTTLAVPFGWGHPTPVQWLVLAGVGFLGALSQWLIIKAYEAAPASVLAPFSYTSIIWTIPGGWLLFGDLPDVWVLLGAAILVACGLYVWHRERVLAAPAAPT
jgi:drug/metabolite transporter (DMT)-like permease